MARRLRRVMPASEQNFGCSVPERDDLLRRHVSESDSRSPARCFGTCLVGVGSQGNAKSSSEPEIRQLEVALLVDEQILGLEVSMKDSVAVAVVDSAAQLEGEFLGRVGTTVSRVDHDKSWQKLALTMSGPMPSPSPTLSMYFFKSRSRNSNTRYNFASSWQMSCNLRARQR